MKDLLQKAARQARHYWLADGLAEILVGIGFLVYGGLLGGKGAWAQPAAAGWLLLWVVAAPRLLQRFKAAWTYPRGGYVVYRRERGWQWLTFVLAVLLLALIGGTLWGGWTAPVSVLAGVPALLLALLAWRMAHVRLWLDAVLAALGGLALAAGRLGWAGFYLLLGGAFLLGGLWQRWTWRRTFTGEASDAPSA